MRARAGVFEKSLMEIWNGPAYGELLSTYRNRPLCLECSMRKPVVDDA